MKTKSYLSIVLVIALALSNLSFKAAKAIGDNIGNNSNDKDTVLAKLDLLELRESITFVMGTDEETDNPYYNEASNYYRYDKNDRTNLVITHCLSLKEVRDYLSNNPPSNGDAWGKINVVAHGNQWLGLSVPIAPGMRRATIERIQKNIKNGTLKEIADSVVDNKTEIFIHGCGIGNNEVLIDLLADMFGGEEIKPIVKASRLFEYYITTHQNGSLTDSKRYFANAWFTHYKMGYKPSNTTIANRLKAKYPEFDVNWNEVVEREVPRFQGDAYHYTFEVPILWVVKYKNGETLPDVSTNSKKLSWIAQQEDLTEALNRIDIPADKFNWWFRKIKVKNEDGTKSPAIWVNGYCTIFCVIEPQLEDNSSATADIYSSVK